MPKAVFKGALCFGLVTIPIKVYPAVRSKGVQLKTICGKCHSPLQYKRWCSTCQNEVSWNEVEHGFEISKGKIVPLTKDELKRIQLKSFKILEIQSFTEAATIDPIYLNTHYYLVPQEGGERAYSLLRDVLSLTNLVAIGKITMHTKEHVVVIRPYGKGLLMTTLFYRDEVGDVEKLEELQVLPQPGEKERELAKVLVQQLVREFRPEEYRDTYRQALMDLIRQKAEGIVSKPREEGVKAPVDLMKALEASLAAVRKEKTAE